MIEPPDLQNVVPLQASVPAAPLESILCAESLLDRPSRPPDHEKENAALAALVGALANSPRTILQTLADKVLEVLDAGSAGLSLLTKDGKRFFWAAIAGAWQPHLGGGTPRDFGPCGDVLDRNTPMLFTHWERRYPYLSVATPHAEEGLLVPFFVGGKSVGTIWAIAHHDHQKFDAEAQRLLESMGRFASAAYQTVETIDELKLEIGARERAEAELRELTNSLEAQVQIRTRELDQRKRQLAEATRLASLGVLTASIAHEVNQPLTAIVTNAETSLRWLGREQPDIERARTLTERAVSDARRAFEIIEHTRDLVRQREPDPEPVSIEDVINSSLNFVNHELQTKGIVVSLDLAPQLPRIAGDHIQLEQVVINLIINAIQAMAQLAPAERRVSIRAMLSDPGTVRCTIEDSGPGLDPQHLARLFDQFFTTKDTGLGMGLAICRSIIEAHSGSLRADNDSALRGARFSFDLPTCRAA
jgi:signal transduction histidine kinase